MRHEWTRLRSFGALRILWCCGMLPSLAACAVQRAAPVADSPSARLTPTAYVEQGQRMFLAVDVRAARVQGPDEFLPLLVAVQPTRVGMLKLNRESFTLELSDGQVLPLASYEEFAADYKRRMADVRLGDEFGEVLRTRLPVDPFPRIALDFFPTQRSRAIPRDEIELRAGAVGIGYLYFRRPPSAPDQGIHRLLVRPVQEDETYLIAVRPYAS